MILLIGEPKYALKIEALRGGTAMEITTFINDLDSAYNALYSFYLTVPFWQRFLSFESSFPGLVPPFGLGLLGDGPGPYFEHTDDVLPEYRLELRRVSIQSPGFWEFVGGLNPLEQLRKYLKDRHERRKDREYRELEERERLRLENELLQREILAKEVDMLRKAGADDGAIQQYIWSKLGRPFSRLGRHQDSGLIAGPAE